MSIVIRNVVVDLPNSSIKNGSIKSEMLNIALGGRKHSVKDNSYIRALDNVSLTVENGEKLGLIGHNGAGKTTFLRTLAGIYKPTRGIIKRCLKVYPILYKSFMTSPELSGYVAARAHFLFTYQTEAGFNEYIQDVIEFSGLGEFIMDPIKTYSEGMSSRLLFSMLTYGHHECLVMDEGLGAGDEQFYKKAVDRLNSFINRSSTLILASHSEDLLKRFCDKALVFDRGRIAFHGQIDECFDFYRSNYVN